MPLQQTVTIVNNSGKIISSGKKLFSIFKEAKGAYDEKKAELQSVKRAQTFDASRSIAPSRSKYDDDDADDDEAVRHRHRHRRHRREHDRPALTEDNLRTHSETSSVVSGPSARRSSAPTIRHDAIDMDLAYGNVPPDLADRTDLDPRHEDGQQRARRLVGRVEKLLDEAHCLQHSAGSIIRNLQEKPDAAAEVALTLADLSSAVAKMSPAFVSLLKSGSPAVFALLASPQFLIGTTIAVGVTVVMFGGWKIVKRIHEDRPLLPSSKPAPDMTRDDDGRMDEALVVDDQLGSIDNWRRGIMSSDESADLELITPEADRATRAGSRYAKDDLDVRSHRSGRTSSSTSSSSRRRGDKVAVDRDGRSRRSSRAGSVRAIEEGGKGNSLDLVFRPKPSRQGDNMLKAVFRNKEKESRERSSSRGGGGSTHGSSGRKRELVLAKPLQT
ncbi:hypothetical protein CP533_1548 [Ophiocordyceps camponoti-saundersi (nom. inval.)]|nr:hypothetical protein CP533_1548 [Ophiocordyceps camponoti-saundersi (nom. inval.)]